MYYYIKTTFNFDNFVWDELDLKLGYFYENDKEYLDYIKESTERWVSAMNSNFKIVTHEDIKKHVWELVNRYEDENESDWYLIKNCI
mgnify:CR=1 FL=1